MSSATLASIATRQAGLPIIRRSHQGIDSDKLTALCLGRRKSRAVKCEMKGRKVEGEEKLYFPFHQTYFFLDSTFWREADA